MNKDREYLFSVVMTIYNTEKFLKEAIDSVIDQTISFEKNIQLILVNNATEDKSGDICLDYKRRYPENVEYVVLDKNAGPAGGRNAGIPYIRGKYVNFFDSDDKWGLDVFEKAYSFLEKNEGTIDIATCNLKYFGRREEGFHQLDYKFTEEDRVIDINVDYKDILLHVTSSFIRADAIGDLKFDQRMYSMEDALFINQIILKKGKYGALAEDTYYFYRKRADQTSRVDSFKQNKEFFTVDLDLFSNTYFKKSKEIYGMVIPYIQFLIMYMLKWRLRDPVDILSIEEIDNLKQVIINDLKQIEDDIIIQTQKMPIEHKIYAFKLKYGPGFFDNMSLDDMIENGYYKNRSRNIVRIHILELDEKDVLLEGTVFCPFDEQRYCVYFEDQYGNRYEPEYRSALNQKVISLGEEIFVKRGFDVHIPHNRDLSVKCHLVFDGKDYEETVHWWKWGKLSVALDHSYYYRKGIAVLRTDNCFDVIHGKTKNELEEDLLNELKEKELIEAYEFRLKSNALAKKKARSKKKIWICGDRFYKADDNGEVLFHWLTENKKKECDAYYAISKYNPELERIKSTGKTLISESEEYQLMFSIADYRANSAMDAYLWEPYSESIKNYVKDKYPQFIYLEHGTTEKDLSRIDHKFKRNYRIYVSSAKEEYDWFLKYDYGYTEREMRLFGMPRYDSIIKVADLPKKKMVMFAPTYRANLRIGMDENGKTLYNPDFKKSEYFRFYNNLINDDRILKAMREYGYKGNVRMHPAASTQLTDFQVNDLIDFQASNSRYIDQFIEHKLMITDYSSIAFDYAYANCAVIYCPFDKDTFYGNHTYDEGFYDYENEGFGPVCYNYEDTVKAIVKAIENDCVVEEKYRKRKEEFFEYFDGKNCQRIYEDVLKLF